ncbi:MAG TPA: Gfo/Idh/MocA family oxidoreductase [Chitinophagaceae bacterium]|nr:Gfo/Idh/MocA family oxidoreductase [Chitinophagaceae bacterium]
MEKIRFALVGCGKIGERHAGHILSQGVLQAVCDVDRERLKKAEAAYGVKGYADLDEMLGQEKEIDVVSVCTPNGLHAEHSIKALRAGYHVLCEKPMAISSRDCGEMIKVAEQMNRRLFVIKQNRYNPPVAAVKKALDENRLGTVYNVQLTCFWNRDDNYYRNSWKGTKLLDGGSLFTQFSHFIDLLYWFFGDVQRVAAFTENFAHTHSIEFEDSGVAILQFYSGPIGTINFSVNSYKKNMEGSLTIIAEKGTVKIGGQYLNTLEYQCIDGYTIEISDKGNEANQYGTYVGSMSNHDKVYANIIAVLRNGDRISTNFFEGLKTVEIIEKIYQAAQRS